MRTIKLDYEKIAAESDIHHCVQAGLTLPPKPRIETFFPEIYTAEVMLAIEALQKEIYQKDRGLSLEDFFRQLPPEKKHIAALGVIQKTFVTKDKKLLDVMMKYQLDRWNA